MIVNWFLGVLGTVLHGLMSVFPHVTVPSWLTSVSGPLATVMAGVGSMGAWFPVGLLASAVSSVFAAWLIGFGIKVVRIVASFLSAGGGSAA